MLMSEILDYDLAAGCSEYDFMIGVVIVDWLELLHVMLSKLLGHPLKCSFYSIFWLLNKSFNGYPWTVTLQPCFIRMPLVACVTMYQHQSVPYPYIDA